MLSPAWPRPPGAAPAGLRDPWVKRLVIAAIGCAARDAAAVRRIQVVLGGGASDLATPSPDAGRS